MDELDKAISKFLYELTELCRRHGMYLEDDTYSSHGETYGYLKVENFGSEGTEAYYYTDEEGEVQFGSPDGGLGIRKLYIGTNPPVDDVAAFNTIKERINKLFSIRWEENRKASQEAWAQWERAMHDQREMLVREHRSKPRYPACNCGKVFDTKAERDRHCETTGHGPSSFDKEKD